MRKGVAAVKSILPSRKTTTNIVKRSTAIATRSPVVRAVTRATTSLLTNRMAPGIAATRSLVSMLSSSKGGTMNKSRYNFERAKGKVATNMASVWSAAMARTVIHFCTSAKRVTKNTGSTVKASNLSTILARSSLAGTVGIPLDGVTNTLNSIYEGVKNVTTVIGTAAVAVAAAKVAVVAAGGLAVVGFTKFMVAKNQEAVAKYGWDIFLDAEVIAHQQAQAKKAKEASGDKEDTQGKLKGKPGEVKKEGNQEIEIGEDGRADRVKDNTDHGHPKSHENPRYHDIEWGPNGNPIWGPGYTK